METQVDEDSVKFKSLKRRKVARLVALHEDHDAESHDGRNESSQNHTKGLDENPSQHGVRSKPPRKAGIAFTSGQRDLSIPPVQADTSSALVPSDSTSHAAVKASGRFTAATGQLAVQEDKHLTAYIDAKLAALRSIRPSEPALDVPVSETSALPAPTGIKKAVPPPPATQQNRPPPRERHKPRPRPVSTLTEADAARNAAVEALLASSVPEARYAPADIGVSTHRGRNPDADARMAAEFEREWRNGVEERRERAVATNVSSLGGGMAGRKEAASAAAAGGPKMGGSKNAKRKL